MTPMQAITPGAAFDATGPSCSSGDTSGNLYCA
eukprot:CAMPEP_0183355898 /NCGR_PEP_ID=MMETSP0164_2-20130417/42308_1 /TAXON_ID=221442 /ORGANISM="Coccolithus pelagicus ssp braarudi, Strain PLY182g" /LENGTH=32 /DNA_ID= /DNA_START= /DNA_END= /DNA_ORIENTATION=